MQSKFQALVAVATAVAFLIMGCASANQPVGIHMAATQTIPEHDEVETPADVTFYYPNKTNPREVVLRRKSGGMCAIKCLDESCKQQEMKVIGMSQIPEGVYQTVNSDDPNIVIVKNQAGTQTLGYFAGNTGNHEWGYYHTLKQAQEHEHKGETLRKTGKVILIALAVTAVVAVFVLAAAAGAPASPVYPTRLSTASYPSGYTTLNPHSPSYATMGIGSMK